MEYKKAAIYEVPTEIAGSVSAFLPGEYVFYYQVGNDLYQVFYPESPDCETQKIFSSEKPFFSWFLSNYRMLIGYESQAFQEALARVNTTGVDEPMPAAIRLVCAGYPQRRAAAAARREKIIRL